MKNATKAIAPQNGSASTGAPSRRGFLKGAAIAASAARPTEKPPQSRR